jgi:uncharacterized protein
VNSTLLILGASARAAAWSALRAGFSPIAVDWFVNRDLEMVARTFRLERAAESDALPGTLATLQPCPWMYCGPFENQSRLIGRIASDRPLWGVGELGLDRARDPAFLADRLQAAGLPSLPVIEFPIAPPREGSWLLKPRASSGGVGITPINGGCAVEPGFFAQRQALGKSYSALFIGDENTNVHFLGVTRQLIGGTGGPFAYQGTVAPWPISKIARERIMAVGAALTSSRFLVGLFGVDFVMTNDDVPWPVEINPRYTAAVEALELATGQSLLSLHRRACEAQSLPTQSVGTSERFVAKGYVFADRDGVFRAEADGMGDPADPFRVPKIADVPHDGETIARGEPVLTVFGAGATPEAALAAMEQARAEWSTRWDLSIRDS